MINSGQFKKGFKPWNTGRTFMAGVANPNWRGGLPKCSICDKQLATYGRNKCRSCSHIGLPVFNTGKTYFKKGSNSVKGLLTNSDNPNWKGGRTPLNNKIRHLDYYAKWRTEIFVRDNYRCVECDRNCNVLHVDHYPKGFAALVIENNIRSIEDALNCEVLWDKNNARTLCIDCHKVTTTYLNAHYMKRKYYD